jgi:hypothetical protein
MEHQASCDVTRGKPCSCGAESPPPKYRVLRVLEYTYADAETMNRDMGNWHVQGVVKHGKITIKSAVLHPDYEEGA